LPNRSKSPIRTITRDAWKLVTLPFLFLILIPILALLLRVDINQMGVDLRQTQVQQAIGLSLVTSLSSVVITILFGTPVAYYLSHPHYRFYHLVDTLVDLPTVLPPAVAGLALLMAFGRRGLLGGALSAFGISLPFTPVAVVMAQTFVAAPFYIKAATLGLQSVDCELRKAASLDGANRWQTFRYVMAPIAAMSILGGAVMTWARALGEFGATIIFAGNFPGRTQTMPLAIYLGFELDIDVALSLSVILIGFSFLALLLVKVFLPKKIDIPPEDKY
jgi:molybdate transport system permease protein